MQSSTGVDRTSPPGGGRESGGWFTSAVWWPGLVPVVAVLAVTLVAAAGATPADQVLVVEDADTGEQQLAVAVDDGTTVTIAYTHSVEKTPVRDVYVVDDRRLRMTRMQFQSYGWGLPARDEVEIVDGWFVTHPDWSGRELYVKPGRVAGHRLLVDGHSYDLVALSDAETVRVRVVRRSQLDRLLASVEPAPTASATPSHNGT